ncbi:MAG TPA: hypothetical protein VIF82_04115 [Burkholderiaceae bacterium]|jgi:hypothetical protein
MADLDDTHTSRRLQRRISELEAGDEIAKRDIYAVLNEQQQHELESELESLQALKKQSKARTAEDKKALGWKTIREVRIEVLKRALAQAEAKDLDALKAKQDDAEVRRARIYMEAFYEARKAGKSTNVAHTWANNQLTRAGLNRMDCQVDGVTDARAKAILELDELNRQKAKSEMTADELEQLELLEEHFKMVASSQQGRKDPKDQTDRSIDWSVDQINRR